MECPGQDGHSHGAPYNRHRPVRADPQAQPGPTDLLRLERGHPEGRQKRPVRPGQEGTAARPRKGERVPQVQGGLAYNGT